MSDSASDQLDEAPLIAVTANVTAGQRRRCVEAGASDYVAKPVDTAELLNVLGEWLPAKASVE